MSSSRTKCLSTKLTEAEYATLEQAAGAHTLSAWARAVLLEAAAGPLAERATGARLSTSDRSDPPRADARCDDSEGSRLGPATDDPAASRAHVPVRDPTSRFVWRPDSTGGSSWDPGRTGNGRLTRSSARFLAVLALACASAGGIGAYRYARIWTPLQRQYLGSYVWSAVAISRSGSYELLVIVDRAARRTAYDADVVPVVPTSGGDTFALTATAVSRGAVRLAWQRGEYDHAALRPFLRSGIYQNQTLLDLARPSLWGALAVLVAALVPAVADRMAWGVKRASRSTRERSARWSIRRWKAWRRHLVHRKKLIDRRRGDRRVDHLEAAERRPGARVSCRRVR